jgi:hypothetical protein
MLQLRLLSKLFCFPIPSLSQIGTLLVLPLFARLVVMPIASGSSLRGFLRTRTIHRVDGYSYSQFYLNTLTEAKAAESLGRLARSETRRDLTPATRLCYFQPMLTPPHSS